MPEGAFTGTGGLTLDLLGQRTAAMLPISSLRGSDSPRVEGENDEHTRALAESGTALPPIVVHRPTMRVIDGMHRLNAARRRGETEIAAVFFDGSEADAFVLGVELNAGHGLPLSLADRKVAAARIIASHRHWSDRAIGAVTGLAHQTVAAIRRSTGEIAHSYTRLGRDGRSRPLDASEGRRMASEFLAQRPDASLREVARAAGVSLGTASDVRGRMRLGEDPLRPGHRRGSAGPGRDRTGKPLREQGTVIRHLRSDPSFRSKEVGRMLLRLIEAHATVEPDWGRLADAVPAHLRPRVIEVAKSCLDAWQEFVRELDSRDSEG